MRRELTSIHKGNRQIGYGNARVDRIVKCFGPILSNFLNSEPIWNGSLHHVLVEVGHPGVAWLIHCPAVYGLDARHFFDQTASMKDEKNQDRYNNTHPGPEGPQEGFARQSRWSRFLRGGNLILEIRHVVSFSPTMTCGRNCLQ